MPTRISPARAAAFALIPIFASTFPLTAQAGAPPASLEARMRGFVRAVVEEGPDSVAAYFPRRGDWLWVHRNVEGPGDARPGAWRFRGEETLRAMSDGGPLCSSYDQSRGDTGPFEGVIGARMWEARTGWRRVRGTRFVPPGASARSPAYVEWRREDGQWVVSAIGDEQFHRTPRPPGPERTEVVRDRRPRPRDDVHAASAEWYVMNEPILFEGMRYVKYGLPRPLADHEIERIGTLAGVGVYTEAGRVRYVDVLYVQVAPGQYHPYQGFGSHSCR